MDFRLTASDWVLLGTAALVATACALVGSFLVLRRMALIGDAISHAILPGIAIGFILTQSLQSWVMLAGAAAAGLVTVYLVETLYRTRRLHEDAAVAVVFPALFALGVILISRLRYVHLDQDCIIYGRIEFVEARGMVLPLVMTLVNLAFVVALYDVLKLSTFDPPLAQALGFSPTLVHYLLMSAVSLTTVACFEAVGAVLVVALLIVPAAAAYLLADRLWLLLVLAVGFGLLSAGSGFAVARALDSSVSGAMATAAGAWFLLAWLAAPRYGLLATLLRRGRLRRQFMAHLLLLHFQKAGSLRADDPAADFPMGWHGRSTRRLLRGLEGQGLVRRHEGRLSLTAAGEAAARAEGLKAE
jgi:manganese/zinc/iron transport system permease protein